MVLTPSEMVPLGTPAPRFSLPDPRSGKTVSFDEVAAGKQATLVMFLCNHCPYVVHVNPELVQLGKDYAGSGLGVVAISSNDVKGYPQDGPELMAKQAEELGYAFPYLFDEDQSVAKAYRAACTPDLFLFDSDLALAYRGQFDSSRPRNDEPIDGADLRAAAEAVAAGRPVPEPQVPSIGCNIKWRRGNEPEWFG